MTIGMFIQAERKKLKICGADFASLCGICPAGLFNIEYRDSNNIQLKTLQKISKAFGHPAASDFLRKYEQASK